MKLADLLTRWQTFVDKNNQTNSKRPPQPPFNNLNRNPDITINRLIEDSREVEPGDCFIARVRPYSNGHPFIPNAIEQGATLIIGQEDAPCAIPDGVVYWRVDDTAVVESWLAAAWHDFPAQHLTVVGVTGTDGKTSVVNLLYEMFRAAGVKTGMMSTIKAVIGNHEEPTGLHVTTPQAPQIQELLRRMVDDGMTHCIVEATSMGLAEHRADTAFFDTAVITNITHEHLDYHGNYANYLRDKGRLVELAPSSVLNQDDKSTHYLASRTAAHGHHSVTYGINDFAHLMAKNIRFSPDKTRFVLSVARPFTRPQSAVLPRIDEIDIESHLLGTFNIYNMLAAAATALIHGQSVETIKAGLEAVGTISGRMERIDTGQSFLTVVDFAHTPNGLEKAIGAGRDLCDGRIITVFGSAGRRDVAKRQMMAEVSVQHADLTVLTAEDPRNDSLDDILATMAAGAVGMGGRENETFWRVPDRGRAIYHALSLANEGDLVLICGKGHEQSMNFDGVEYPWDDRNATRVGLNALLSGEPMADLGLPTW